MKRRLFPFILLLVLIISACSSETTTKKEDNSTKDEKKSGTITYESETGPIEVPADPQRVILLSGFTGNVIDLGVNIVRVDLWSKSNPTFEKV